jgi:hypothetical protein
MNSREAAEGYADLGFDAIPLHPGTKDPIGRNWPNRPPDSLWRYAKPDSNVGLRCGGEARLAVLDCDDKTKPGTFTNAQNFLAGLGYMPGEYPVIQTASASPGHVYVTFTGTLAGHSRHFSNDFGAGEFKYGNGTQVAAPPSIVGSGAYILVSGDFRQLPKLEVRDVLPVLGNQNTGPEAAHPSIPSLAWRILLGDKDTIGRYATRSEAEQACIASLINAGHDFDSVLSLFTQHPGAGKFAEMHVKHPRNAIKWLKHSFDEACRWTSTHDSKSRTLAEAAITWATSRPWPGRTGATDRAVFTAHASIAARAGRLAYGASCRELAELAAVGFKTAIRATHRLTASGLITLEAGFTVSCPNRYRLQPLGQDDTLPKYSNVRECVILSKEPHDAERHDAFRSRYLGKTAAEIWALLQAGPLTAEEIAERTGRHFKTVKRNLARMRRIVDTVTGEVIAEMVTPDGDKWQACADVDLDDLAKFFGTAGKAERQKRQHAEERRIHRQSLEKGRREHAITTV